MAKKKKVARAIGDRIDLVSLGIDLRSILDDEIKPYLTGTHTEIGERACGMPHGSVSNVLNGSAKASLGYVAALAKASGGRLIVSYEPPPATTKGKK